MSHVIVIGGGVSGLATAALLAADGHDVELHEARDQLGGRAGTWEKDGFRFDTGPSWYLMPEVFEHFFALLGTSADEQLDLVALDPAYRVYSEGHPPFDVVSGRAQAVALFESIEAGAGAKIDRYLDAAEHAYHLSVDHFLYDGYQNLSGLRHPAVLRSAPQLVPSLSRSLARHVDARFTDTRLRQVLGYPAVFLGGTPYTVPALYQLMSHLDLNDGVLYPQGGMYTFVAALERLARERGVRVHLGSDVRRMLVSDGRAHGVELADGTTHDADLVVAATDLHHLEADLLGGASTGRRRERTPSSGALLLLLGVRGEVPQLAHHTLLFTADWQQNFDAITRAGGHIPDPASLYVCAASQTDPSVAPTGDTNLFVLVPAPANPESGAGGIDRGGDEEIERTADRVIAQIAQWCDIPDLAERIVVRRTITPQDFATDLRTWQGNALGMAHTLRQSALLRDRNTVPGIDGLYRVGADVTPGIGLPMCLISAEIVTKLVRGETAPGRIGALRSAL
ncbi:phytoene desaturase [Microbacterium keratanolyticum]|uniref:Phytoene desaturase n=1 Tax=Microbacterium keratanolyticum TaxID=67574 RepID=A0A9W6M8C8_9MICO|nr:phytoene desaturase family protein [Microbacterium keratanolyticum]MBM7469321.1 phytoene desaturase [Microbacterium keratanolyticum]GLK01402.1 phytoene desaturase [Microbacterium keratanolyticum]